MDKYYLRPTFSLECPKKYNFLCDKKRIHILRADLTRKARSAATSSATWEKHNGNINNTAATS